jgi:Flp pilus assembly protein TadG
MDGYQVELANRANSRGSVLVMAALLLTVFIGIAALSIDIGYLSTTKNELQNTADAAALAAAGYLGNFYIGLPEAQQGTYVFTKSDIEAVAIAVAEKNRASGVDIVIESADIIVGQWDESTASIATVTLQAPDAVYVKARRDNTANSPIGTFFAGIFGIDTMSISAEAVASLSGPGVVAEGELITPFALSEHVFPNNCTDLIEFSPTTSSCAAWHNFFDPINAAKMEDKLWGFIEADDDDPCEHCGDCETCDYRTIPSGPEWLETNFDISKDVDPEVTPEASAGVFFNFQGGAIASLFLGGYLGVDYNGATGTVYDNEKKPAPMLALFDYFRYRDGDGDDTIWTTTIPVYKDETVQDEDGIPDCDNANDNREILGFARVEVLYPDPPPSTNIQVRVDCSFSVVDGRGGGGAFSNVRGTIPHLVK